MEVDSENIVAVLNRVFGAGIPEDVEGKIDVDYFCDQPNASVAKQALDFLKDQSVEFDLRKRGHSEDELARMWRTTFRACIGHGVPIPSDLVGYARRLGVTLP